MIRRFLFLIIIVQVALSSCVKYDKSTVLSESTNVGDEITEIAVSSGCKLILDDSLERGELVITAPNDIHNFIKISILGEKMSIYIDTNSNEYLGVEIRSSSQGVISYIANGGSQISTSSIINVDNLNLDISGASEFSGVVVCNTLNLVASSKSTITLRGECGEFKIVECSGVSTINGADFSSKEITAKLSGGSTAYLHPVNLLSSKCIENSHIIYIGESAVIESHNSDGSTVKPYTF